MAKIVYVYNPACTNVFVEAKLIKDVLPTERYDEVAPPKYGEKKIPILIVPGEWQIIPDHRGTKIKAPDGSEQEITMPGYVIGLEEPTTINPITARQLKIWLAKNGLYEIVENTIQSFTGDDKILIQIEWKEASLFERKHPLIMMFAKKLDMSDEVIDNAFKEAALI